MNLPTLTLTLVAVALDTGARLAIPFAIIGLAHGNALASTVAAAAAAVAGLLRSLVLGRLTELWALKVWLKLIDATSSYELEQLSARSPLQSSTTILQAAHDLATTRALTVPRITADGLGLIVIAIAVLVRLDSVWILAGTVVAAIFGMVSALVRKSFRRNEREAFVQVADIAQDLDVLLEAPAELRGQCGRVRFDRRLVDKVAQMAAAERRANMASAWMGVVPVGIALAAATLPFWRGAVVPLPGDAGEIAALGGAALVFLVGLARGSEQLARTAERRRLFHQFVAGRTRPAATRRPERAGIERAPIVFQDVSVVYPGAERATPSAVTLVWPTGQSMAVTGANGAGKSTLAMVLMGLITPARGAVMLGDRQLQPSDFAGIRARTVYVPQVPYIAEARSVRWHLDLMSSREVAPAAMREALETVGLWDTLEGHLREDCSCPLDVPAGELSGGERKRMLLARVELGLQNGCDLVIVDEPEGFLDRPSRVWLEDYLARASARAQIMLIAHDEEVIPSRFLRVHCEAGPTGHPPRGHEVDAE